MTRGPNQRVPGVCLSRAGFRTPSPIFLCFVEPRDGVGGSETTRWSGASSAGMNRVLGRLSAPAYRLNNNPSSWPQRTRLYRLGEAGDIFKTIDVYFMLMKYFISHQVCGV